ncbi:hypothetical protein ATM97_09200 [Nocardia sp. MH4]|uniref:hypothetical protein n=1 Tax=Nocardia TaxID=1817 RepID=UPI001C4EA379|nr:MULTISPECIES: hypothetical protein [Nocardia]MBW0274390.1 hypothetical protein [Nocardia sp. MH4]
MTVDDRLLRTGSRPRATKWSLGPVELTTGGVVLTAAGLAMIGPLIAALLIHRSGGPGADAAATTPLILLTIAIVLALSAGIALFVTASRRR